MMDIEEIKQRTDRLQRQMELLEARLIDVEKSHSIADVVVGNIDRRLGSIEDSQKWIVRLIVGAIILGLVGLALGRGAVG